MFASVSVLIPSTNSCINACPNPLLNGCHSLLYLPLNTFPNPHIKLFRQSSFPCLAHYPPESPVSPPQFPSPQLHQSSPQFSLQSSSQSVPQSCTSTHIPILIPTWSFCTFSTFSIPISTLSYTSALSLSPLPISTQSSLQFLPISPRQSPSPSSIFSFSNLLSSTLASNRLNRFASLLQRIAVSKFIE